ncbi:MAG: metal ABC transporter substrate-binding protein, partial [Candidatus Colwellbacteria bacterium]|nr:metal ABC transporter substrate-binding protein [Candidatus Colwellbacteria bacterium]
MKKNILISIAVIAGITAVSLLLIFGFRNGETTQEQGKVKVLASFFPVYDIVRQIGGDEVEVRRILPAGASPHTFDITPKQAQESQGAKISFRIGIIDDWISDLSESVGAKDVSLRENIEIKEYAALLTGGQEGDTNGDPHYWLTMKNAKLIAETVARELAAADP